MKLLPRYADLQKLENLARDCKDKHLDFTMYSQISGFIPVFPNFPEHLCACR